MSIRVYFQDLTPAGIWRTRDAMRYVARGAGDLRPLREVAAEMERAWEARREVPVRARGWRGARREEYPAAETERLAGLARLTDLPADAGAGAAGEMVLVLRRYPRDGERVARHIQATIRRNRRRDRAALGLLAVAGDREEVAAWVRAGRPRTRET